MLRILRSPEAHFGTVDRPTDAAEADRVYGDGVLAGLAADGYNAVWVRVIFRELLTNPRYPRFGASSAVQLASLRQVVERGRRHGVKLVLYCQEPLGLPRDHPFWSEHPGLAGTVGKHNYGTEEAPYYMRAFCTSSDEAREFLQGSSESLLREVPGVGGVVTITASEFMSHCYSHHRSAVDDGSEPSPVSCPRCAERPAAHVVAEVLNCMRAGMDEVDRDVPLIAWNWSWTLYEPDPQPGILERLRPGIDVMAGFERGGSKLDPGGVRREVDEYSLSYAGPSPRFTAAREAALRTGRRIYAKLQIGTTHEIASVSNLPLIPSIYRKARAMRELGVHGFMGCWNFGNTPSLNTRALNWFLSGDCPANEEAALEALVAEARPQAHAPSVCAAWRLFCDAFEYYPFCIPFLYYSPLNYCLALPFTRRPLWDRPLGRSWLMDPRDDRDDPSRCFGPYGLADIAGRLGRMCELWGRGVEAYKRGLAPNDPELDAARAVGLCLRSARNYFRLVSLKRSWGPSPPDTPGRSFRDILHDEIGVIEEAMEVYSRDRRQGYHGEAHAHMVNPEMLREKRTRMLSALSEL